MLNPHHVNVGQAAGGLEDQAQPVGAGGAVVAVAPALAALATVLPPLALLVRDTGGPASGRSPLAPLRTGRGAALLRELLRAEYSTRRLAPGAPLPPLAFNAVVGGGRFPFVLAPMFMFHYWWLSLKCTAC